MLSAPAAVGIYTILYNNRPNRRTIHKRQGTRRVDEGGGDAKMADARMNESLNRTKLVSSVALTFRAERWQWQTRESLHFPVQFKKKKTFLTSFFSAGDEYKKKTVLKRRRGNSNCSLSFYVHQTVGYAATDVTEERDRVMMSERERRPWWRPLEWEKKLLDIAPLTRIYIFGAGIGI